MKKFVITIMLLLCVSVGFAKTVTLVGHHDYHHYIDWDSMDISMDDDVIIKGWVLLGQPTTGIYETMLCKTLTIETGGSLVLSEEVTFRCEDSYVQGTLYVYGTFIAGYTDLSGWLEVTGVACIGELDFNGGHLNMVDGVAYIDYFDTAYTYVNGGAGIYVLSLGVSHSNLPADLNRDGIVDLKDLAILSSGWLTNIN